MREKETCSMTPERKDEIKHMLSMTQEQCERFVDAGEYSDQDFIDLYAGSKGLLVALEESERRNADLKTGIKTEQKTAMKWYGELSEAKKEITEWQEEAKQWRDDLVDKINELGEAHSQIDRLQTELSETKESWTVAANQCERHSAEALSWEEAYEGLHRSCMIQIQQLAEAQQTIARLESEKERFDSLMDVLKDATELISWRDPGGGRGQVEALKIIYKWLSENPSPSYLATLEGTKES